MDQLATWISVFVGGGLGSMARFGVSLYVVKNLKSNLPIATFFANLLACLVLVWAVNQVGTSLAKSVWFRPLIIVGFCGGFSTFSTFSYETMLLLKANEWIWAMANVGVSVLATVVVMWFLYKTPVV
tara:strand:- start:2050 stop:2430 length:381 start_codon:yes stop_codon:yes gene_type:complete